MKKLILLLIVIWAISSSTWAQGSVKENVEQSIVTLMSRFTELNKSTPYVKGWRIQILATTDRQRMEDALRQFGSLYPNIPSDWVHTKPYYKVRAGAFTTKRDALRVLYILKRDYPTAYPVQDDQIKPEELLR